MNYHAPTRQFTIDEASLKRASGHLRQAIRHIRKEAGLPLTTHVDREAAFGSPQFAEVAVLAAADAIGIDMGADQPGQLDVSDPDGVGKGVL